MRVLETRAPLEKALWSKVYPSPELDSSARLYRKVMGELEHPLALFAEDVDEVPE